ncbi:potassium channel protein [Rhodopirellula sp. JC740]|uniref:Potassium channel protein n=1 Tax=Rhodopirellula halodulae TaxID=2894198 RepID=A0ABS8NP79_9BACT|nr:potassium channel protein [Rhodopirellula sp. JC740]MCC9645306.1 potassium channel protein [Rhodopirellula sp. JC740]
MTAHKLAPIHPQIARLTAPWMFAMSVMFLVAQAILIVMWVDVPNLRETTTQAHVDEYVIPVDSTYLGMWFEQAAIVTMLVVWPIVLLESIYHWIIRPKTKSMRWFHFYTLMFCICPSLRMCARSYEMHGQLWLPGMSWQRTNKRLRRRLAQHFSVPMIGIALLILPVLVTEFFLRDQVARYQWLRIALHVGTGVIWFAFAAEFILMVSIAEKKLQYIRHNWVDLAIILLPFFSFLRSLQAVRGTRLAKLAKIPQLAKLARAYRLRGTALKGFRALVILGVATRLFKTDKNRQLERLQAELTVARRETRLIRLAIARLEREIQEECEDSEEEGTGETD